MATFKTNPLDLYDLLKDCHAGVLQLPDFQRSWVWDEDRIKSLIASISRAFPVGALMTLDTDGEVDFKPRAVEGAPVAAKQVKPHSLLLDGQQRITSLYQVTLRGQVVETVTPKNKKVKRWFYIDIAKALDPSADREEAIVTVPESRIDAGIFGRAGDLDLSTPEKEYKAMMYPVSQVFDWDTWQDGFNDYWRNDEDNNRQKFREFKKSVLENFKSYRVPVIALDRSTTKEAVCVVFEKVNTGGKPLDAFELVTAMYAASGHELRKDWYGDEVVQGRHRRLIETLRPAGSDSGILANVSNTDFLQAISLFHTRDRRREAEAMGKQGKELPAKGLPCGASIRLYPHFKPARSIPVKLGKGGHGGGDDRLMTDVFGAKSARDPYLRAANYTSGAMSILIGAAANKSMRTGQPVKIASLVKGLPPARLPKMKEW